MSKPDHDIEKLLREILLREADFLARQLILRKPEEVMTAVTAFEARVRPKLLTTLEDAAGLNLTYPRGVL